MSNTVFLHLISEKIMEGDYDKYFTIPFMSKELLISTIKNKLDKKIAKSVTPMLTDSEVILCINEVKETAANVFMLYLNEGFIEKTEEGYDLTNKGRIAIKESSISFMFK